MSKSRSSINSNPLLGASGTFSLDSPALLVPAASNPVLQPPGKFGNLSNTANTVSGAAIHPPTENVANFFTSSSSTISSVSDPFANVGLHSSGSSGAMQTMFDNSSTSGLMGSQGSQHSGNSLSPSSSTGAIFGGSTSSMSGLPEASNTGQPQLFLLPNDTNVSSSNNYNSNISAAPPPPSFSIGGSMVNAAGSGASNLRKSRYVAPPGINSVSSVPPVNNSPGMPMLPSASNVPLMVPNSTGIVNNNQPSLHLSNSTPDFSHGGYAPPPSTKTNNTFHHIQNTPQQIISTIPELVYHWFFLSPSNDPIPTYLQSQNSVQPSALSRSNEEKHVWKPFSMIDSVAIEDCYANDDVANVDPIPTDGGRYDVNIPNRTKTSVYWSEEPKQIRRCSWFYQSNVDGRWVPYSEQLASRLEEEYTSAHNTGRWGTKLEIDGGEFITLHSSTAMMHFPTATSSTLDDWGQVQPPQDPMLKPRIVHRGLEGLPEIPDGEDPGEVDHLVFVIHGIGSACDMKLRSIVGVTDGLRELTADMSERHFSFAHLSGKANRVEFLPINWHKTLHGEDEGTDSRLKPMTLRSIPKLRGFVNDTLLDVLFYTSPVYCQKILDTVSSEINRMYTLFMARNEKFTGEVSIIGHSLGSLIIFDILCNQTEGNSERYEKADKDNCSDNADLQLKTIDIKVSDMPLDELFQALNIDPGLASPFVQEGIDFQGLLTCGEEDLKEGGLPLEPRKQLLAYIDRYKRQTGAFDDTSVSGLEAYNNASTIEQIKYTFGPAGTGQPSVKYPKLMFSVSAFYALGSPIGMFMAVRGIDILGPDFKLPTCPKFFNIFHPYDPVAYRMEALIKKEFGMSLKPVTIPHHKGRKRMHLELKDTVTKLMTSDFKQTVIDSVSAAIGTVYNIATGTQQKSKEQMVEQMVQDQISNKGRESPDNEDQNPKSMDSQLNQGNRIDFVLQEAPFESFNEYVFALGSHLCYWDSEDTALMILKEIYSQMNIMDDQSHSMQSTKSPSMPEFPRPPTAILAPPPTPMGGPMLGPSVPISNVGAPTPILKPPPTPLGGAMAGPPILMNKINESTDRPSLQTPITSTQNIEFSQKNVMCPPSSQVPMNDFMPGPPPMIDTKSTSFVAGPPSSRGYPKPSNYPTSTGNIGTQMGMDPTAPITGKAAPIGPPPMGGFVRK